MPSQKVILVDHPNISGPLTFIQRGDDAPSLCLKPNGQVMIQGEPDECHDIPVGPNQLAEFIEDLQAAQALHEGRVVVRRARESAA